MDINRVNEVLSDEKYVESLCALDTPQEVQKSLSEKGIVLSEEDILAIREFILKVESGEISQEKLEQLKRCSEEGELSDEELENASGGGLGSAVMISLFAVKLLGASSIVAGGATVCGLAYGAYQAIKRRW